MNEYESFLNVNHRIMDNNDLAIEQVNRLISVSPFKQNELSARLDWTPAKLSKTRNHKQKMTPLDCRNICGILGCVVEEDRIRNELQITKETRDTGELIRVAIEYHRDSFEMAYEYLTNRISSAFFVKSGFSPKQYRAKRMGLRHRKRGDSELLKGLIRLSLTETDDVLNETNIEFGLMFVPEMNLIFIGIWSENANEKVVSQFKSGISSRDLDKYHRFFDEISDEIPNCLKNYENTVVDLKMFSLDEAYENYQKVTDTFREMFEKTEYIKRMSSLGDSIDRADKISQEMSNMIDNTLSISDSVDHETRGKAIDRNKGFFCDVDSGHMLFNGMDGKKYLDYLWIVPRSAENKKEYGEILNSELNVTMLCPFCHSKLLFGDTEAKEEVVLALYSKHKDAMEKEGLHLSIGKLLKWHNALQ